MKLAYIILSNGNPQAVVTDQTLVLPTIASLSLRLFQEIKNSPTINDDEVEYEKQYKWSHITVPHVSFDTKVAENALREQARTHVPETFPKPPSQALPGQAQVVRKQIPAVKPNPPQEAVPAATTLSQHSDPSPGVQVELRRTHEVQLEIDKNEEGFTCRSPIDNNSIVGKGETAEQATANYFDLVSREKVGI